MKKTIATMSIFFFCILLPDFAAADFIKDKIAVLDFQLHGKGYNSDDMGKIVAEWLITSLVKEGRFDVVERRLLKKLLEEQSLAHSGVVDENTASKLGKLLGVKAIISGTVMKLQDILEVNTRIIDVETASVIAAENIRSTNATQLKVLIEQMAEKIVKDFPLEGYVVKRSGNKIAIDLGKRAGIKREMHFIVYKEGDIIKHPKTGQILDVE